MDIYGILALIFGIIGTITSYWYIGLIPGVIGLVLGIIGMTDAFSDKKFSLIGLLVSIFGIVASVYVFASDLDSEKLVVQVNKFDQDDAEEDDSFMRFHQEGWTPDQMGEEVNASVKEPEVQPKAEEEKKAPAKQPDEIALMCYAQTVLKDLYPNCKYAEDLDDYQSVGSKLRYKIEGDVAVAGNDEMERFYMIIQFTDADFEEYDLISLQIGDDKMVDYLKRALIYGHTSRISS